MFRNPFRFRTFLLLATLATGVFAQASPTTSSLPVTVQRQGTDLVFAVQSQVSGLRAALYDAQGKVLAESGSLTETPPRWIVPTKGAIPLLPGTYLGVFWLRGQGSTTKRVARLQLEATTQSLQSAEEYLMALEPAESLTWGSSQHRAAVRRAYQQGHATLPFFRLATKVLAEDTTAHLLLLQALQSKYSLTTTALLAPPPPPPPPPPAANARSNQTRRATRPTRVIVDEFTLPQPTPEEKQEMLAAGKKAVAVGKTCAEKNNALQWLASAQGQLDEMDSQLATLEELGSASCASPEVRSQSWYSIGVICWQCSYEITTRYADARRADAAPFHFRKITKEDDQQKMAACLQRARQAIDKALELEPDSTNSWAYRSLLFREQQKTTASSAEWQKLDDAAADASRRALELARKQQGR